jgi:hypothetical protein
VKPRSRHAEGGFRPDVFGVDPSLPRLDAMRAAMGRYSRALASHNNDRVLDAERPDRTG